MVEGLGEEDLVGFAEDSELLAFVVDDLNLYFGGAGSFFDQKLDLVDFAGVGGGLEDVLVLSFLGMLDFSDLLYV